MKSRILDRIPGGRRTFFLVFEPGDSFLKPMAEFVRENEIGSATFTGLGALSEATLAWFDPSDGQYKPFHVAEQVECASMVGNVSWMNEKPFIHAHCVLGRRDGTTLAGHVKDLKALPTLEVTLTEHSPRLERKRRPDTGFALIDIE
jgi:predicted DNA-binding protein with PD1-like motif